MDFRTLGYHIFRQTHSAHPSTFVGETCFDLFCATSIFEAVLASNSAKFAKVQLVADRNKQHQFTNFAAIWEKMLDLLSVSWHSQQNTHHLWSFLWKSVNGTYSAKISQARNQLYKMKFRPRNPPSVSNPGVTPKLPSFVELRIVKIGILKKWCSQFFFGLPPFGWFPYQLPLFCPSHWSTDCSMLPLFPLNSALLIVSQLWVDDFPTMPCIIYFTESYSTIVSPLFLDCISLIHGSPCEQWKFQTLCAGDVWFLGDRTRAESKPPATAPDSGCILGDGNMPGRGGALVI